MNWIFLMHSCTRGVRIWRKPVASWIQFFSFLLFSLPLSSVSEFSKALLSFRSPRSSFNSMGYIVFAFLLSLPLLILYFPSLSPSSSSKWIFRLQLFLPLVLRSEMWTFVHSTYRISLLLPSSKMAKWMMTIVHTGRYFVSFLHFIICLLSNWPG